MVHDYYVKGRVTNIVLVIDFGSVIQKKLSYGHVSLIYSQEERGLLTTISKVDVRTWASL